MLNEHLCQDGTGRPFPPRAGRAESRAVEAAKKKRPKKLSPELRAIANRATGLRERSGMTHTELAKRLGIHPSQLSRFEDGYRMLKWETMLRLCQALGSSTGYIFGGEGPEPAPTFVESDRRRRKPESE